MMHTAIGLDERKSRKDEVSKQIKEILERSQKEEHIKSKENGRNILQKSLVIVDTTSYFCTGDRAAEIHLS